MQAGEERYQVRPNPSASGLFDVIDTMHGSGDQPILGGEALPEAQARALAAHLNRLYREWRDR